MCQEGQEPEYLSVMNQGHCVIYTGKISRMFNNRNAAIFLQTSCNPAIWWKHHNNHYTIWEPSLRQSPSFHFNPLFVDCTSACASCYCFISSCGDFTTCWMNQMLCPGFHLLHLAMLNDLMCTSMSTSELMVTILSLRWTTDNLDKACE